MDKFPANKFPEISVFFPAYNEEANIANTVQVAEKVLKTIASKYEIIIINDGSTDKTGEIVAKLVAKNHNIRVVTHSPNRGYGAALKSGWTASQYPWIAFADSDGQFDFSEIKKFLPLIEKADLILGYRLKRGDSLMRSVYTFGWSTLAKVLLGLDAKDYSCGFKLIKKKVFEAVQPLKGEEKVTQIELIVKAKRLGFKIAEVGVHHYPRKFGQQTGANLKVVLKSIFDLFKLWRKLK